MYRFLLPAVAGVLTLALTGPAHAHGRSGGPSRGTPHNFSSYRTNSFHNFKTANSYFSKYGTKFSHGYRFNARNFYWNSRYWSGRYGCYYYWNPYANNWYYWYAPQSCYYPISYITTAPPAVNVNTLAVANGAPIPSGPVGPASAPPTVNVNTSAVANGEPIPGGPVGPAGPGGGMPPAGPPVP